MAWVTALTPAHLHPLKPREVQPSNLIRLPQSYESAEVRYRGRVRRHHSGVDLANLGLLDASCGEWHCQLRCK